MGKIYDIVSGKEYEETGKPFKLMLLAPNGDLYRGDILEGSLNLPEIDFTPHNYYFSKFLQNFGNIDDCLSHGIKVGPNGSIQENDNTNLANLFEYLNYKGYVIIGNTAYYFKTYNKKYINLKFVKEHFKNMSDKYNPNLIKKVQIYYNLKKNQDDLGIVISATFKPTEEQIAMVDYIKNYIDTEGKKGFLAYSFWGKEDLVSVEIDKLIDIVFSLDKKKKRNII